MEEKHKKKLEEQRLLEEDVRARIEKLKENGVNARKERREMSI